MTLTIQRLQPAHERTLAALFATIAADPAAANFHPHVFSAASARDIAGSQGKDIYLGLWADGDLCGYGLLRGWDAGFAVPSLGIYLAPAARGRGLSRPLMTSLHGHARSSGADRVRLKVYPDNQAAVRLYETLGYVFGAMEGGQRVGLLDLMAARDDKGLG